LNTIYDNLNHLRSSIYHSAQSAPNSAAQSKMQKLLDQMETFDVYGSVPATLPDQEYLFQVRVEMRKKLRIVEDMLSSNKGRKDQEWINTSATCKACIQVIISNLDLLEGQQNKQSLLLEHLHELKESVHEPINEIMSEYNRFVDSQVSLDLLAVTQLQKVLLNDFYYRFSKKYKSYGRMPRMPTN